MSDGKDQCVRRKRCKRSVNDDVGAEIDLSRINSNSNVNIMKEAPARRRVYDAVEWGAAWSLLHLADFAPSETIALPKQTLRGDRSSASLKESHSNMNQFKTPNSIMASNSSVQTLSVNPHQHGQICVSAPTSNTSHAASISPVKGNSVLSGNMTIAVKNNLSTNSVATCASHSKMIATHHVSKAHSQVIQPTLASSIITQGSSRSVNLSRSPVKGNMTIAVKNKLSTNSVATCASHSKMIATHHVSKAHSQVIHPSLASSIITQGSSRSVNLSRSPVKGNSVLSGNMTIAVKNKLSTNRVATCASHSKMIATLHVSKAHSQVIQPSLASSIITQGEVASPSSVKASTSKYPQIPRVKKKEVKFSIASIYHFNRTQGFTAVPSQGGCTLGMERTHTHMEVLSTENYGKKKIVKSQLNKTSPVLLSDGNEDSTEESNDLPARELEVTCDRFKPLSVNKRRTLLLASGVKKIDASEKKRV